MNLFAFLENEHYLILKRKDKLIKAERIKTEEKK